MSKMELIARDIYQWCKMNNIWGDIIIYFDGKAWSSYSDWSGEPGKKVSVDLYEYFDRNPKDYFEYANTKTLSMSFEGMLYYILNGHVAGWEVLSEEFRKLLDYHGYYYELGHAWNLAIYEN